MQFAVAESLSVYERVLDETFRALRECGKQRDECVVYWTGPVDEHIVDGIVQPPHSASPQHYHVDDLWITRYFLELRSSGRTTRDKSTRTQAATYGTRPQTTTFLSCELRAYLDRVAPLCEPGGRIVRRLRRDGGSRRQLGRATPGSELSMAVTANDVLDRTTLLINSDFFHRELRGDDIVHGLMSTTIRIIGDEESLSTAAGQAALVTMCTLAARMGLGLEVDIPAMPVIGPQPPIRPGANVLASIAEYVQRLVPGANFNAGTTVNATYTLGREEPTIGERRSFRGTQTSASWAPPTPVPSVPTATTGPSARWPPPALLQQTCSASRSVASPLPKGVPRPSISDRTAPTQYTSCWALDQFMGWISETSTSSVPEPLPTGSSTRCFEYQD